MRFYCAYYASMRIPNQRPNSSRTRIAVSRYLRASSRNWRASLRSASTWSMYLKNISVPKPCSRAAAS